MPATGIHNNAFLRLLGASVRASQRRPPMPAQTPLEHALEALYELSFFLDTRPLTLLRAGCHPRISR